MTNEEERPLKRPLLLAGEYMTPELYDALAECLREQYGIDQDDVMDSQLCLIVHTPGYGSSAKLIDAIYDDAWDVGEGGYPEPATKSVFGDPEEYLRPILARWKQRRMKEVKDGSKDDGSGID